MAQFPLVSSGRVTRSSSLLDLRTVLLTQAHHELLAVNNFHRWHSQGISVAVGVRDLSLKLT